MGWFKSKGNTKIVTHEIDFSKETQVSAQSQETVNRITENQDEIIQPVHNHQDSKPTTSTASAQSSQSIDTEQTASAQKLGLKNLFGLTRLWDKKKNTEPTEKMRSNEEVVTQVEPTQGTALDLTARWQTRMIFAILVFAIFVSAFMVVRQVYDYRKDYRIYNQLLQQREQQRVEWGRLVIEQQTFGATAQVGTRAVTQLKMYSPPVSDIVVIASDQKKSTDVKTTDPHMSKAKP